MEELIERANNLLSEEEDIEDTLCVALVVVEETQSLDTLQPLLPVLTNAESGACFISDFACQTGILGPRMLSLLLQQHPPQDSNESYQQIWFKCFDRDDSDVQIREMLEHIPPLRNVACKIAQCASFFTREEIQLAVDAREAIARLVPEQAPPPPPLPILVLFVLCQRNLSIFL